jgi:putative spermidine/putrescine transport system ATP-binding protein
VEGEFEAGERATLRVAPSRVLAYAERAS